MTPIFISSQAAQGDLLIRRISALPQNLVEQERPESGYIVAHSETGHHHVIAEQPNAVARLFRDKDPTSLVSYLDVSSNHVDVVHLRTWDTHRTLRIPEGVWEIRRQREYTPEGWRQVAD